MSIIVIPNLSGSEDTFYKFSASSEFSSDFHCWHAFNYDIEKEWPTFGQTVNYWIEYEHLFPIKLDAFAMVGRKNGENPQEWRLECYNEENKSWNINNNKSPRH